MIGEKPVVQVRRGGEAVARARQIGAKSDRERAYIDAVSRLYADFEHTPQPTRLAAYRDAMAGARLEQLFAKQPNHPGLAHYIIHTDDVPALADRAVDAAHRYARIAPSAPHALHMPSHTFTRVGFWDESIEANVAAAAAAKQESATPEELHASDYQTYAYLQTGRDRAARRILDALPEIASRFDPNRVTAGAPPPAAYFALAAIPARYALERGAWAAAAHLEPRATPLPYVDAITYFARALGADRAGDTARARTALDALAPLRDRLTAAGESYWAEQVEIQRRGASAWLAFAEGRVKDALSEMRTAADREDATEKAVLTPGPLAPARELLGEMLLQLKEPAQALKEFAVTLTKEPNRFRALAGAAQAATATGNREAAKKYSAQLLKMCARADKPERPELQEARKPTIAAACSLLLPITPCFSFRFSCRPEKTAKPSATACSQPFGIAAPSGSEQPLVWPTKSRPSASSK